MLKRTLFMKPTTDKLYIINLTPGSYHMEGGCDINGSTVTILGPGRHELCFCNSKNILNSEHTLGTFGIELWGCSLRLQRLIYKSSEIIILPDSYSIPSLLLLASSVIPTPEISDLHLDFLPDIKLYTTSNIVNFPIMYYNFLQTVTLMSGWLGAYTCKCIMPNVNSQPNRLFCTFNTKTLVPKFITYDPSDIAYPDLNFYETDTDNSTSDSDD